MPRFEYELVHHQATLHDELIADGITPTAVEGRQDLNKVWITVAAELEPQVSAVVNGHDGEAAILAAAWHSVRLERNARLLACDWTDLPNSPVPNANAWEDYRTALRDIPQTFATVDEIVWPTKPA